MVKDYLFLSYEKQYPINFTIIGDNASLTGRELFTVRHEIFIKDMPDHRQIVSKFEKFEPKCPSEYRLN